jgi:hypothetical protein
MTNPTPLSPAAQAVLDAANNAYWLWDQMCPADANVIAAAALRAAADQVVPEFAHDDNDIYGETMLDIRHKLLAIAAELEGTND